MSVEPRAGPVEGSLSRRVSVPSNTLVLLPHLHDHDTGSCEDLLSITDSADENVLAITFEETAADKARRWDERFDSPPNKFAVVDVPFADPSDSVTTTTDNQDKPADPTIHTVSDATDLVSLGQTISRQLSDWEFTNGQTVVCFQSLTPLIDAVELRQLFRFLHVLCHRLKTAGAVSHFHLDPEAIDERTIYTLIPIFDAVVAHDDAGALCISNGGVN